MPQITKQIPNRVVPAPANKIIQVNGQSAWDLGSGIKMLLYGESATGKTTLWATFPGPILALICSGGIRPGELRSIDTPEYRRKIDARIINSSEEYYQALENVNNFATVVQDHGSGLADIFLKELMGTNEIIHDKYRIAGKGESWSVVSQQQYGQLAIKCKEAFRAILNVNQNVVIVCQQRVFGGKDDGISSEIITPTVGAALTPSVTGWLNPACDYVVQTFKRPKMITKKVTVTGKTIEQLERGKGVSYCLRCEPHDVYQTKFRRPKSDKPLPDVIVDPTFDKILAVIRGETE